MSTTPATNHRASLLAGLRTGGVRSTSVSIPHTAAPGGSFNLPRFASHHHSAFYPEEDEDELPEMPHNVFHMHPQSRAPMTAAVDGPNNRFSQQQHQHQGHLGLNPNSVPFNPGFPANMLAQPNNVQTQALQMQMMQLEIMRIQAVQAQQYQTELLVQAQAQRQQQQQQQQTRDRRSSLGFNPPATAGPLTNGFDLRGAALNAQLRRANEQSHLGVAADEDMANGLNIRGAALNAQLRRANEEQVPMTAALGGRFGARTASLNVNTRFTQEDDDVPPPTPSSTTVISGGTSLGNPASNNVAGNGALSKSDSATSWRRGGNNNSVLSGNNRSTTSPSVKVTPPGEQRVSPPPSAAPAPAKFRPQPLRFSVVASQPMPAVAIDASLDMTDNDDAYSSSSSKSAASNSSPTTPRSSSSNEMSLSPREEASKKLYEGLGIGRPVSAHADPAQQQQQVAPQFTSAVSHRMASQPMRQPRGPPSGADELGPKNFATRIRRKAIGGLGMLMGARERREFVEAY